MGRHARALSKHGYSVIGIDRDADVIAKARALAGGPSYVNADIRDYQPESAAFDAAIVMSQSFGYFDATTNQEVLGRLADGLREGGRVILDLWNAEFFVAHQGQYELKTPSGVVRETKRAGEDRFVRAPGLSGRWRRQFRMAIVLARANDFDGRMGRLAPVTRAHRF
jgi:SAM-dependent methyltransferase